MKRIILLICLLASVTVSAQDTKEAFLDHLLLGKGKTAPMQIFIDAYPFLFLANGGGGSLGTEFGNWQVGVIGFSTVPPDFIKNTFFEDAENVTIKRNNAVELFANYYARKDRRGIYGGVLGGPEWFVMEDKISGTEETILISYVVPRIGIRVFPFKKNFYADASFGWSFNISGTETKTLGQTSYNASAGGFIYFLQVGARFNVSK